MRYQRQGQPRRKHLTHRRQTGLEPQCEQCYGCLEWCPQEAIQYGKNAKKYPLYHQPEIQLKDVLNKR